MSGHAALGWVEFIVCSAVIVAAGTRLSTLGDRIATLTGLGGNIVGLALMAVITSLPEVFTGASAVLLAGAPDIAIGNLLGACMLVIAMVAVVDSLHREASVYASANPRHALSAAFAFVMLALVAWGIAAPDSVPAFGHVGATSPVLVLLYAVALAVVYRYERRAPQLAGTPAPMNERTQHATRADAALPAVLRRFASVAVVVVAASLWLPFAAERLAMAMGWDDAFIGTAFVALATTLPEIAVTLGALRVGALDLATGNLLGSVLFNMLLVAVNDTLHAPRAILTDVSSLHALTALCAAVMAVAVWTALRFRARTRLAGRVAPVSVLILAVYALGLYLIARAR